MKYQKLQRGILNNWFIAIHIITLVLLSFVMLKTGFIHTFDTNLLCMFDCGWYSSIKDMGYEYKPDVACNLAFFPIFPYVWRFLNISILHISILNATIWFISLIIFKNAFNLSNRKMLVLASVPSSMFFFVPYTESFFFIFTVFIVSGYRKNHYPLLFFGFLMASMIRPAGFFFIPAIIAVEFFRDQTILQKIKKIILNVIPNIIGLASVVCFQYWKTGIWFASFKAQTAGWDRSYKFPTLPFYMHNHINTLWLDGIAIIIGILSIVIMVYSFFKFVIKKDYALNSELTFSLIYFIMVLFSSTFYSTLWFEGRTCISSINRYMFATPFILILLINIPYQLKTRVILAILGVFIFSFYLLGFYSRLNGLTLLDNFLYMICMMIYFSLYIINNSKWSNHVWAVLYIFNSAAMIFLLYNFVNNVWVG